VVDEVLAVGDAEFQKKAIGKMQDVSKGEGRTVLFVSHNMDSVRKLCHSGVVLKNGQIDMLGTADECVNYYVGNNIKTLCSIADITDEHRRYEYTSKELELISVKMLGNIDEVATDQPLEFEIVVKKNKAVAQASMEVMINDQTDTRLGSYISEYKDLSDIAVGNTFVWKVTINNHNLVRGRYSVCFNVGLKSIQLGNKDYDIVHDVLAFNVLYVDSQMQHQYTYWPDFNGHLMFSGLSVIKCI
jgi:energy-coupling factor transporter ATP-binding protein EcfA2